MVHRRCTRILRNETDADDATQDVFVRLVRRGETLTHERDERVGALLWTMATQVSLNRLRTKRRKPEDGAELIDVIASAEDIEERTIVGRTLDALFAREQRGQRVATRTLAVLRYVDGMTLDEVADATGVSAGAIRKRLDGLKQRVSALETQ